MFYIKDGIVRREVLTNKPSDIECISIEIKLGRHKWILIAGYNPEKGHIS